MNQWPPAWFQRFGPAAQDLMSAGKLRGKFDQGPATDAMEDKERKGRTDGILPFHNNAFDRVFIGVVILIGVHLLWLRFMEPALPIGVATAISLAIGYFVVRRG